MPQISSSHVHRPVWRQLVPLVLLLCLSSSLSAQKHSTIASSDRANAEHYYSYAVELSKQTKYDSSNIYLDTAIAIFEAMPKTNDYETASKYVGSYRLSGRNHRKRGHYQKAQFYLKKALKIGLDKLGENNVEIVNIYYEIGRVHYKMSEFDLAEHFLIKGLEVAHELVKIGSNEKESYSLANIYNGLGSLYFRQGFNVKAMKYYSNSLDVCLKLGPQYESMVAGRYNNLGIVTHRKGDYAKALEYYQKYLDVRLKLTGRSTAITTALTNIGRVYTEMREYKRAIQFHQEALDIMTQAESMDSLFFAWCNTNLASVKLQMGRYDEALNELNIALSIWKRRFNGKGHYLIVRGYLAVGDCYRSKGDFENAILYYRKALAMGRAVFGDSHPYVAQAEYGIGHTLEERHDLKEALKYYQRSLKSLSGEPVAPESGLDHISGKPLFLEVLARKGAVLKKLYAQHPGRIDYLEQSLSAYQMAIRMVDKIRMSFKNDGSKLFLGERSAGIYEDAIRTALQLFDASNNEMYRELSFSIAQMSKANILREKLHESEAKQFSGIPDSLLAKEDSLRAGLTYYDTIIKNARTGGRHRDKASLQRMKELHFSLSREFDALREQFERDYPKYHQLKYKTQAVSVERVQEELDADAVFLEYVMTDSSLFIFAISKDKFHIKSVDIDSSFSTHVNGMLDGIRRHNYEQYVSHAHSAYTALILPLESWLADRHRLIVVPDGLVSSVPFEALLTSEVSHSNGRQDYRTLPYLNKKFAVSYGYSTSLLFETVGNQVAQEPTLDYLAFAPAFSNGLNRTSMATLSLGNGAKSRDAGRSDTSLPGARNEVFAIKNMFDKSYRGIRWLKNKFSDQLTRVYVGEAATEDKLKSSRLSHSRYVHFATHGVVNKELPSLSGLAFGQETSNEDGILYLGEIYNLRLDAELVVLSACETANGKWVEGEGLISFARGFLYAGARNLLVSLWKVSDVSTSNVMQEFYHGLLQGKAMANALKEAKDRMIASEYDFAMPYYWASFVAIGK